MGASQTGILEGVGGVGGVGEEGWLNIVIIGYYEQSSVLNYRGRCRKDGRKNGRKK